MSYVEAVPIALFNELVRDYGKGEPFEMHIEDSTHKSKLIEVDETKSGASCFASVYSFRHLNRDNSIFTLWPRRPEEEFGLVSAARSIFKIRGGFRETGIWFYNKGNQNQEDIILDFGYYSVISLSTDWGRKITAFMAKIFEIVSRLSIDVSREVVWDGQKELEER